MKKKIVCTTLVLSMVSSVSVYAEDVSVTVPAYLVSEDMSELPEAQSSDIADDGSITYVLDSEQQELWKEYLKSGFDDSINAILDDDTNYPNIQNITYNDDMTEFTISFTSSDNLTMSEWFVAYLPLFVAPIYQEADGSSVDDVDYTLTTIDSSTHEEVKTNYEENKSSWESMESFLDIGDASVNSDFTSNDTEVNAISFDSDASCLEYSGFETMLYDSSQTDTLGIVKFNYTNKTDSPSDVTNFYNVIAYQNGIELDWYLGSGNQACDNAYKTILKDTTLEIGYAFMLQDLDNPITVYVYDGFMTDSPCQIQEISIK